MLVGCEGQTNTPANDSGTTKESLVAYRSADELGLIQGTTVIAKASGTYTEPSGTPLITDDGHFIFARSSPTALTTIDVQNHRVNTVPIPVTQRLGTGGGSTIVWLDGHQQVMQLDLTKPSDGAIVRQVVDLPPLANSLIPRDPMLVAARNGTVILTRVESDPSPFGGPDTLYAIRSGSTVPLGKADTNTPVSIGAVSPDGDDYAFGLYRRSSNACGQGAVTLIKLADRSQQTIELNQPPSEAVGSRISKMWWPAGGPATLSYSSWNCSDMSTTVPQTVWQLAGDRLVQPSPDRALEILDLAPHERAIIIPEQSAQPQASGTLVIEINGKRTTVRAQVSDIAHIDAQPPHV
ncbi:hypothetical protein [Mycobacterium ostraviense]|uniref:hypothetical protein n=1 Tax=Mycobacterium ostraviense TaxID=2738409 RepID=UPI000A705749|nr:hypothetical protein [Mycobacterium ostraviense]UGT93057.1 hypothetical protein LTS72_06965 [Mycobacterium ostraviense]